jgi:hypothetical protein
MPANRLPTFGDHAFPIVAAPTWNNSPPDVMLSRIRDIFKSKLETYQFTIWFSSSWISFPSVCSKLSEVHALIHFEIVMAVISD